MEKICAICGAKFETYTKIQKYCSNECRQKQAKIMGEQYRKNHRVSYLKIRFQIFERDGFKCQYCGRGVKDDVVLVPDHIIPRIKGGRDTPDNLITSCRECNAGKSDILIDLALIEKEVLKLNSGKSLTATSKF